MHAFCAVFLGWPVGEHWQKDPDCLFGRVDAYFFKFETTGKGLLLAHGMISQRALCIRKLRAALEDGTLQTHVTTFMRSFCCAEIPMPEYVPDEAFDEDNPRGMHLHVIPLPEASEVPAKTAALQTAICKQSSCFSIHGHRNTCFKRRKRKRTGDPDRDCRWTTNAP